MSISPYLAKTYDYPKCWNLVVDYMRTTLGVDLTKSKYEAKTKDAIRDLFVANIDSDTSFKRIESPKQHCIVLLYARGALHRPYHVGVFVDGKVLHAGNNLVLWQDLAEIEDYYGKIEYWEAVCV